LIAQEIESKEIIRISRPVEVNVVS
jgi:hypothetical protein